MVWKGELYVFAMTLGGSHEVKEVDLETLKRNVDGMIGGGLNFVCVVPETKTVDILVPNGFASRMKCFLLTAESGVFLTESASGQLG